MSITPVIQEMEIGSQAKIMRPYLEKQTKSKRSVGIAQVVEHLPSKLKALTQSPLLPKNKIGASMII
jgi:hypothetical protein